MSQVTLQGNASGTGIFTVAAPNSNTNRTLSLPDATGTVIIGTQPAGDIVGTTATQTLTNKDIVATQLTGDVAAARITTALNASGSAPIYAARAWVNFNGTGTVAIRASGNVSSITDNGTGNYTVNFTTALSDTNYAPTVYARANENTAGLTNVWGLTSGVDGTKTTTAFQVNFRFYAGTIDTSEVGIAIFR
jgi:hypothetical protein